MDNKVLLQEFEHCKDQLRSYILRMTTSVEDTEDIIQDTYIKAQTKLDTFKGESSLKTWLFSIASNLAKDLLKAKKRWPENVTDICKEAAMNNEAFFNEAMQIRMSSPQGNFEIKEHIAFCFTCVSRSLPLEQQLVVFLKEVYDFSVKEIAQISGITEDMTKYYLRTGRAKMMEVFDRRCSLINKEGICHQCTELNGIFNPKQNKQEALAKVALTKAAEKEDREHLFNLRMEVLRGIDPFKSGAAELQLHHLEHNRKVMEKYLEKNE